MRPAGTVIGFVVLALVGCGLEAESGGPEPAGGPASTLQCTTDLIEAGHFDYAEDAPGLPGEPVEVVEQWLADSLEATDELTLAGDFPRPGGTTQSVAVIRDGSRIALVHLTPAAGGGWLVASYEGCADTIAFP